MVAGDISMGPVFLKPQPFQFCLGRIDMLLVLIIYLPV